MFLPLAVGLASCLSDCFKSLPTKAVENNMEFETRFNDSKLLLKTLTEFGACINQEGPDAYSVQFTDGEILYHRLTADAPYRMTVRNIENVDSLMDELRTIEEEYNGNVQEYTYRRVMDNLPEGMTVDSEEVLDDNSIMVTLNVG